VFTAPELAFRTEVRAFLREHDGVDGFHAQGSRWERVRALYRAIGARGWLSLGWPKEAGGAAKGAAYEYILWDEMAYARAARPPLGAGIVAKTICKHGTDAQKREWLGRIRDGESFFSLGYSEPGSGSDLAAVRTRAERAGDHYVVTGEKCWTSYAQHSDFLWTLVQTGDGHSLLILDLRAPGVTVRPLPCIDGEQLNQVHLDGVKVPVQNRIGAENSAWRLVKEALDVERHVQFPPGRLRRDLEELVAWCRAQGIFDDVVVRRTVAELAVGVREVEALALAVVDSVERGLAGDVLAAANKLAHTEMCQRIARAPFELAGAEASVKGSMIEFLYRQSTWETIGGGTSEIMRGVVAKKGLGLGGKR
jgi:alkylation response protein AidB-like acyl-CoA dehydrogenase